MSASSSKRAVKVRLAAVAGIGGGVLRIVVCASQVKMRGITESLAGTTCLLGTAEG